MSELNTTAETTPAGSALNKGEIFTSFDVDAFEGYMDIRIDARTLPWEERLFNTLYPVHTAGLGNVLYKLYVFLTGAALTALGCLGLWAFLRRWSPSRTDQSVA